MEKNNLQIIDVETKGNVVRFYLGENGKQWGDDWNDAPYEHNAGRVYEEYIKRTKDFFVDFDFCVLEPRTGTINSGYSKEDMIKRRVPCLIVVNDKIFEEDSSVWIHAHDFRYWVGCENKNVIKFYFGDILDEILEKYRDYVGFLGDET